MMNISRERETVIRERTVFHFTTDVIMDILKENGITDPETVQFALVRDNGSKYFFGDDFKELQVRVTTTAIESDIESEKFLTLAELAGELEEENSKELEEEPVHTEIVNISSNGKPGQLEIQYGNIKPLGNSVPKDIMLYDGKKINKAERAIVEVLKTVKKPLSIKAIHDIISGEENINIKYTSASTLCSHLHISGVIERVKKGWYKWKEPLLT